ncbi:MAG: hypothetical protein QM645_00950 [Asticcacaulis sp.]
MGRTTTLSEKTISRRKAVQEQRLIGLFSRLMEDCENMTTAVEFAAVEKQAKALSAVRRTLKDIYHKESESGETGMYDEDQEGTDTLEAWKLRLERKLDRLAGRRSAKSVDGRDRQSADGQGNNE